MLKRQHSIDSRLVEMETKIKELNREIETLKRENAELKETNNKLKQSLGGSVKPQPPPPRLTRSYSEPRPSSETANCDIEVQRQLNRAIQQLSETRQQLMNVQERLTVAEQVTAATQRRELLQEGVYENLPPDSVYETLRLDSTEERVYATIQSTTHTDVLRAQYSNLATKMDAHIVAVHMYQRNALTLRELQSIQSQTDRPVEAADTLLNIIMEQRDAVYLDVLKHTGQQHIYQTLVEDGYKDYDDRSSHTGVIRAHYVFLLTTLDVKFSGLVDQLYSDQVLSAVEKDDISAEQSSFRANEKLLSVLSRKSPRQFQLFLDALDNCGQQHVRNVIDGRRGAQIVYTLPAGRPICGVTTLREQIYLLRPKGGRDQVEMYDAITYSLLSCLTVPNAKGFTDMTSCEHFLCLYISDPDSECVHRLDLQRNARKWPVSDRPCGLSVNAEHNLIVTCRKVRKIKEFSPRGDLLRDVTLPDDVINPWHTIQLTSGQFIVCHGNTDDQVHRVCMVSTDGHRIVHSYGGQRGSDTGQYNRPAHLAVDDNEFVFVADVNNQRVTLLSPTLYYVRQVVSRDLVKWTPWTVCLDDQRRRLYVGDNEFKGGKLTAGRVVVFSV